MAKRHAAKKATRRAGPVPRAKRAEKNTEHNARGYTRAEWSAAGYDPAKFDTARGHTEKPQLPPEITDIIGALSGPGGAEIAERLTSHSLAPKLKRQATPHAHQLAHALESGDETLWYPAALAVAHELFTEQQPPTETPRARSKGKRAKASPEVTTSTADSAETSAETTTARLRHAICPKCKTRADWDPNDSAEEQQALGFVKGFDVEGMPVCPNCKGEVSMISRTREPAAVAVKQVIAAIVAEQPNLFPDLFNTDGAYRVLQEQFAEGQRLQEVYDDDARKAAKSRKALDEWRRKIVVIAAEFKRREQQQRIELRRRADLAERRTAEHVATVIAEHGLHGIGAELVETWSDEQRVQVLAWVERGLDRDHAPEVIARPHLAGVADDDFQCCADCGARISDGSVKFPEGALVGTFCTGVDVASDPGPVPEELDAVF